MSEAAIQINRLNKRYGEFAIEDMNLMIPKGCITGLIGANGAGKSTTIKMILDMVKKDSGDIQVLGESHITRSLKERIGVVLDDVYFSEVLNVKNVNAMMKLIYKQWETDTFYSYVKRFKLEEKKPFKHYSRGMKMKLGIAVALSHQAELLILDEATSGLDPLVRDEMLDVFMEFVQNENNSILMSSHILSDLEKACDYIAFLHDGKLIFNEAKDDLLYDYKLLKCERQDLEALPKESLVGFREHRFGVEALIKGIEPQQGILDKVSIEDIMLFHVKTS